MSAPSRDSGLGFAGRLRVRAEWYRPGARDAAGAASGAWTDMGLLWASVHYDGREREVTADGRWGLARWRVTLRPTDLRVGDRLVWGDEDGVVTIIVREPDFPDRMLALLEEQP